MTEQNFRNFLNKHHAVHYKYKENGQAGMVNIWFYQDHFVLTREECKDGDQYNEGNYTRDEAFEFSDVDAVIHYLRGSGIDIEQFRI